MSQHLPSGGSGDEPTRPDPAATSTLSGREPSEDEQAGLGPLVLDPGTAIGRYLILDHLGAGGMGTVHSAWDRELQRKIALKLVRPERKAGEGAAQAMARFLREAQALAQIAHPNVVTVFDVGPWRDEVYLAMEFVEGRDLRAFLEELPPIGDARRWPRVLEVFREIGRGLAAVHAAGLVHRDLKPANVMVGADGRARVMDFGLARRIAESTDPSRADSQVSSPLEQSFTQTGLRLGTPSYMAPEQFLGQPCDERSDVFAFSVALFEALYGYKPFGEGPELRERLLAGRIEPRPTASPVPEALHRVVVRGLAREPNDRWPQITDLLAAADALPHQIRRRRLAVAAAAGLAALGLLAYGLKSRDDRCSEVEKPLAAAFGDTQKSAIAAAFRRVGPSFGATGDRLVRRLEAWSGRWAAQRRDACEATHLRGEQSEELLDRRMACLDRRLAELRSVVGLLGAANLPLAENPRSALDLLGDLEACADRVQLASGGPLPPAAQREKARGIQQQMLDARALAARGSGEDSRRLATAAIAEAERSGGAALVAEGRLAVCTLDAQEMRSAEAYQSCLAAVAAAVAADDEQALAKAAGQTAFLISEVLGKPKEALPWMAIAAAAAGRLDHRGLLAANLAHTRGMVLARLDDDEAALASLRQALALAEQAPATDQLQSALYNDLGTVLGQLGRYEEAEKSYHRALELDREVYGPDHPVLASTLNNLGSLHWSQQHLEDALQLHSAAVDLLRKTYGDDHRLVALSMNNVATALRDLGRHEEADRYLVAAIAILEKVLPDHIDLATVLGNLGYRYRANGEYEKALALFERAHRIFEKDLAADSFALANSHQSLGMTLARMARFPEAIAHLEKAFEIYQRSPTTELRLRASSRFQLAKALWTAGEERARARRLGEETLAEFQSDRARYGKEIGIVETWLASLP